MPEVSVRNWARELAACPHCGRTVLFDAAGACPSCRVAGAAPVTAEDTARIEADVRNQVAREAAQRDRGDDRQVLDGILVGAVFGILGLIYAAWARRSAAFRRGLAVGLLVHLALVILRLVVVNVAP